MVQSILRGKAEMNLRRFLLLSLTWGAPLAAPPYSELSLDECNYTPANRNLLIAGCSLSYSQCTLMEKSSPKHTSWFFVGRDINNNNDNNNDSQENKELYHLVRTFAFVRCHKMLSALCKTNKCSSALTKLISFTFELTETSIWVMTFKGLIKAKPCTVLK